MSDPLAPHDDGSTPLTDEEREGFKLSYITTCGELNAAEQANILQAEEWAFKRKNNVVNRDFLNDLHQHMFGNVWKWAGKYRQSGKNIGVEAYQIAYDRREQAPSLPGGTSEFQALSNAALAASNVSRICFFLSETVIVVRVLRSVQ